MRRGMSVSVRWSWKRKSGSTVLSTDSVLCCLQGRFPCPYSTMRAGGSLMNVKLLGKLFGIDGRWSGPCTVIVDADADVQSISNDSIVQGGMKSFAPRLITGRVTADAVRL